MVVSTVVDEPESGVNEPMEIDIELLEVLDDACVCAVMIRPHGRALV